MTSASTFVTSFRTSETSFSVTTTRSCTRLTTSRTSVQERLEISCELEDRVRAPELGVLELGVAVLAFED